MEQNERQIIDGLFDKLQQVDRQSPQRDPDAEAHIKEQLGSLPAAPYYMTQALLMQEQALNTAQARIKELEQQGSRRSSGGGFLAGLFGGGDSQRPAPAPRPVQPAYAPQPPAYAPQQPMGGYGGSPWGQRMGGGGFGGGMGGGGFLASAATTALGVAGGMLAAEAISSAFSHGGAEAAGFTAPEPSAFEQTGYDPAADAAGADVQDVDSQPADDQQAGYQEADYTEPTYDDSASDMGDFGDDSV